MRAKPQKIKDKKELERRGREEAAYKGPREKDRHRAAPQPPLQGDQRFRPRLPGVLAWPFRVPWCHVAPNSPGWGGDAPSGAS